MSVNLFRPSRDGGMYPPSHKENYVKIYSLYLFKLRLIRPVTPLPTLKVSSPVLTTSWTGISIVLKFASYCWWWSTLWFPLCYSSAVVFKIIYIYVGAINAAVSMGDCWQRVAAGSPSQLRACDEHPGKGRRVSRFWETARLFLQPAHKGGKRPQRCTSGFLNTLLLVESTSLK